MSFASLIHVLHPAPESFSFRSFQAKENKNKYGGVSSSQAPTSAGFKSSTSGFGSSTSDSRYEDSERCCNSFRSPEPLSLHVSRASPSPRTSKWRFLSPFNNHNNALKLFHTTFLHLGICEVMIKGRATTRARSVTRALRVQPGPVSATVITMIHRSRQ